MHGIKNLLRSFVGVGLNCNFFLMGIVVLFSTLYKLCIVFRFL
jgi:hypothetical protein